MRLILSRFSLALTLLLATSTLAAARPTFVVPAGEGRAPALAKIFSGPKGYSATRKVRVTRGQLPKASARLTIRDALIYAASGRLNPISNPGGPNIHHVTCHILAMSQIVEVQLGGGRTAIGVRHVGGNAAGTGYEDRVIYREGGRLKDLRAADAPSMKLVAFLEGSSERASIVPGKSMGDTWAFWDEIANGLPGATPQSESGVLVQGRKVTEATRLSSALDALASLTSWSKEARHQLRVGPLMRGQQAGTEGEFGHRKVLEGSFVPKGFFSAQEASQPITGRVISSRTEAALYKGRFSAATRTSFVAAVERMVRAQPPAANGLTVYGFGRKSASWATPEIDQR
jgi:hypothetical protein